MNRCSSLIINSIIENYLEEEIAPRFYAIYPEKRSDFRRSSRPWRVPWSGVRSTRTIASRVITVCQTKALFRSCSSITREKNAQTTESWFSRPVGIEHAEQHAARIFQQRSFSKGTPLEYSSTGCCSPRRTGQLGLYEHSRDNERLFLLTFFAPASCFTSRLLVV